MLNWLRHAFGGGSHPDAPPLPSREPAKPSPAPKADNLKRVDTPTTDNVYDRFVLKKQCNHGFPLSPSCMTFDNFRKLLFIGTSTGELRVYGRPGVEMSQLHDEVTRVVQILPLECEPSVITLCSDNILYKWHMLDQQGNPQLQVERVYQFPGGLAKTITTLALCPTGECIFVGTLGGVTYPLDISFEGMSPEVLSWARARHVLGYNGVEVPGEVKALQVNPANPKQLLIGYEHGYLELWDSIRWNPLHIFSAVEGVGDFSAASWHPSGLSFVTSHLDGSINFWDYSNPDNPTVETKKHYEGDHYQEIRHVLWPGDNQLVFSGGVPLDLVDGESVTVVDGQDIVTLQLTSAVRGMYTLEVPQSDMDSGMVDTAGSSEPLATNMRKILVLLLEHEMLFIELQLPDLPQLKPPYLYSVHNSPVKAIQIYNNVRSELWSLVEKTGALQNNTYYRASSKVWPIDGGNLLVKDRDSNDLLITGHEDGSIRFWDVRSVSMCPMLALRAADYFEQLEELRSPSPVTTPSQVIIKTVGLWDPRADDDRVIVTAIRLVGLELLVGFQGGQVLVFKLNNQSAVVKVEEVLAPLMSDEDQKKTARRKWDGPIKLRGAQLECAPGLQPTHLVQLLPPSQVTTMASAPELNILAIGSQYGFAVVDTLQHQLVMVLSTFDASIHEANYQRLQSVRKSFRQSMRRFNVSRSMRASQSVSRPVRPGQERTSRSFRGNGGASTLTQPLTAEPSLKRDGVRLLDFTAPVVLSGSQAHYTLWVGTNLGSVLPYNMEVPAGDQRQTVPVTLHPVIKDYSKRKNFPILFLGVLEGNKILEWSEAGDHGGRGQFLVVCTEDQVKVDSLQSGKRRYKARFKHSAHLENEYRLMSASYLKVGGVATIMCLDSLGYIHILSLPDLKPIYKKLCVDPTDIVGQRSLTCTSLGMIMYLRSPSEFGRYSVGDDTSLDAQFTVAVKKKKANFRISSDNVASMELLTTEVSIDDKIADRHDNGDIQLVVLANNKNGNDEANKLTPAEGDTTTAEVIIINVPLPTQAAAVESSKEEDKPTAHDAGNTKEEPEKKAPSEMRGDDAIVSLLSKDKPPSDKEQNDTEESAAAASVVVAKGNTTPKMSPVQSSVLSPMSITSDDENSRFEERAL